MRNWTKFEPDNIENQFAGKATNVGIRTDTLTDIDLDSTEAIALAPAILPKTATYGRESAPKSHWVYKSDLDEYASYDASFGKVLELRANSGHQSMAPPSVHPSGEQVQWTDDTKPLNVNGLELKRSCNLLAATAVIRHHWKPGHRDTLATCFARILYEHAGLDEPQISEIIAAVAGTANDEEFRKRVRKPKSVIKAVDDDKAKPGIPTLRKTIGIDDAQKVMEWLNVDQNQTIEPAEIFSIGDAPEMPLDCLPPILRDRAVDVANRVSCAVELTVFPGMCAILWAAGSRVRIQMQANNDEWMEPPIFYSFVAMPSGSAKSPARRAMFEPVQDIQNDIERQFQEEMKGWDQLPKKDKAQTPKPKRTVCKTGDITSEGLIRALANNRQGTLLAPDELSGLLAAQNQYKGGRGSDTQKLLEMYDADAISVTRKSEEGSDYLAETQVNLYGTIQPKILPMLYNAENINAGLVARFGLCTYPKPHRRTENDQEVDEGARRRYIQQLKKLRHAFRYSNDGKSTRIILKLEAEAMQLLKQWREMHYQEIEKIPEPFKTHVAKYPGLLGRLVMCFHLAEMKIGESVEIVDFLAPNEDGTSAAEIDKTIPRDPVKPGTVRNAITFLDEFLKVHAMRLYRAVDRVRGQDLGRRIAAEIILAERPESLTVSDVFRKGRSGMRDKQKIATAFEFLDAMGWGTFNERDQSQSKRPSKRLVINQAVFEREWSTSE